MPRINRRKSIVTPPRRDKISPAKRAPMPDVGPTDYTLQRKMEIIGEGTYCRVDDHRVMVTGQAGSLTRAEFASSSALALLFDRNKIEANQYRAGSEYARLHRLLWGRSTAKQSGLSKVLATALPERIEAANRAAREERDDEEYADWMAEQRVLYERGEYRLRHLLIPAALSRAGFAAKVHVERRLIRIALRKVVIDNIYPHQAGQMWRIRHGLNELANVWEIE